MRNLILMIIAYLLGSFPSALVIGKTFYNKDIRNYGSGNLGSTNAFRVLGKKGGAIVFILDILKGGLAFLIAKYAGATISPLIIAVFALQGWKSGRNKCRDYFILLAPSLYHLIYHLCYYAENMENGFPFVNNYFNRSCVYCLAW